MIVTKIYLKTIKFSVCNYDNLCDNKRRICEGHLERGETNDCQSWRVAQNEPRGAVAPVGNRRKKKSVKV